MTRQRFEARNRHPLIGRSLVISLQGLLAALFCFGNSQMAAGATTANIYTEAIVSTPGIVMDPPLLAPIDFGMIYNSKDPVYLSYPGITFSIFWSPGDNDQIPITVSMYSEYSVDAANYPDQFCAYDNRAVCNHGTMAVLRYQGTYPNDGRPNDTNIPLQITYTPCGSVYMPDVHKVAYTFFDAVNHPTSLNPDVHNFPIDLSAEGGSPCTSDDPYACLFSSDTCTLSANEGHLDFFLYPEYTSGAALVGGEYKDTVTITAEETA